MKFGISYNVFDGVELLEDSINQIRNLVDYISVVYQDISYWGNKADDNQLEILQDLVNKKYIDDLVLYSQNDKNIRPHLHQIKKRNIGLELSRKNNCTHHMTMDCDEFYEKNQFSKYIDWCKENPNILGYGYFVNYFKKPSLQILNIEEKTRVSLFLPIRDGIEYKFGYNSPVLVDPTRRPNYNEYKLINPNDLMMHHMTLLRKNIYSKIANAAKRLNYNSIEKINTSPHYIIIGIINR